jgi:hypothetical protein
MLPQLLTEANLPAPDYIAVTIINNPVTVAVRAAMVLPSWRHVALACRAKLERRERRYGRNTEISVASAID